MPNSADSLHGLDRDAILRVAAPVVRAHGAELADIEFKTDRGGWVLRLYVEKDGALAQRLSTRDAAVNLELCAAISRDLSPALDVADLIPHAYHLEVGSPGVERALRREDDFVRFTGEKAKLKLREGLGPKSPGSAGQRVVVGTLDGVQAGIVRLHEGKTTHEIPLSNIESARLVFEFGPRAKPSHRPSGRDTQQRKH